MILDGIDIGLGKVVITDSHATINNIEIPIKCINIYSKDHTYRFTFWTKQEYEKYNDLELNKKTDVLNLIDDYDIDFGTEEYGTINSRENSEVYFTRIGTNKYIINAEIKNFENCVLGNMKNHKNLKLEAIIDFSEKGNSMSYKKIALFGFPASGKSSFAKYLNEKTNIPVYSLDLIRWSNMKDGKKDEEYFKKEYEKILDKDKWIIEGNALDYIKPRLEQADILYFFDTGVDASIKNYLNRENKIANGEEKRLAFNKNTETDVVEWIKTRYAKKIEKLRMDLEKYKDKLVVIHNYDELESEMKNWS